MNPMPRPVPVHAPGHPAEDLAAAAGRWFRRFPSPSAWPGRWLGLWPGLLAGLLAGLLVAGCARSPAGPVPGRAGDPLPVRVIANQRDLLGPLQSGPDGRPDVCLEVPVPRAEILAARVDGEQGDAWQTPFDHQHWDIHLVPGPTPADTRLHLAASQTRRNYRVTLLLRSGALVGGVASLVPGSGRPEGLPPPPASIQLPRRLPADLQAAWDRLPRDGNGQVVGVRVGRHWVHGSVHVQVARVPWVGRAAGGGLVAPVRESRYGDYALLEYPEPVGTDDVVDALPPPGTAVWQVVRPGLYRTSRIDRYAGALGPPDSVLPATAFLRADGPYPGVPVGGDSGSVCLVRMGGRVRVLGVCGMAGTVYLAVPLRWPAHFEVAPGERLALRLPPGGTPAQPYPAGSPPVAAAEATWDPPPAR
ncbi:MAG: hypothetical protein ACKO3N_15320 [Verrucomicrobiota bacterium]